MSPPSRAWRWQMRLARGTVLFFLGFAQISWGQTIGSTHLISDGENALALSTNGYAVLGATAEQESIVRAHIQIMHPPVLPLRVVFVPHWKYVDNTRIFHLHVSTGYTSTMFTHLPSRTVFIDTDRQVSDESLTYWVAHELGHLATNSAREEDAEKGARDLRRRLKDGCKRPTLRCGQQSRKEGERALGYSLFHSALASHN